MLPNLFSALPSTLPNEVVDILLNAPRVRIERIISQGHASPPGFWYDQPQHEWVLVLQGAAHLQFEGDAEPLAMKPGYCVHIPAHRRHRVEWTTPTEATIWLAVHFDA